MEHLDPRQVGLGGSECRTHEHRVFVSAGTIPDDFPVMQIEQDADILPPGTYPDISYVGDHNSQRFLTIKLPVQEIGNCGFIALFVVMPVLSASVCRFQSPALHDAADSPPGQDNPLGRQYALQLPTSIQTAILFKRRLNRRLKGRFVFGRLDLVVVAAPRYAKTFAQR